MPWVMMMRVGKYFVGRFCVLAVVILALLSSELVLSEEVPVGVIGPLTGVRADGGTYLKNGIELAKERLAETPARKYKLKFYFEDSRYSARHAVTAYQNLRTNNKVDFFIGPYGSSETLAVAPLAERNKTIIITPASQSHMITQAGDYVFRLMHNAAQEAPFFAAFVAQRMTGRRAHFLAIQTDVTPSYLEKFTPVLRARGREVGLIAEFDPESTDLRPLLLKIKNDNPTDIFLLSTPMHSGLALKQARELGIRAQYYTIGVESPELLKIAGEAAEGILYPYPYDSTSSEPSIRSFVERYRMAYGEDPDAVAATTFDTALILADCFEKVGIEVEAVKSCLYNVGDYQGASGKFAIDKNGDAVRHFIIKTVKGGKQVPL